MTIATQNFEVQDIIVRVIMILVMNVKRKLVTIVPATDAPLFIGLKGQRAVTDDGGRSVMLRVNLSDATFKFLSGVPAGSIAEENDATMFSKRSLNVKGLSPQRLRTPGTLDVGFLGFLSLHVVGELEAFTAAILCLRPLVVGNRVPTLVA